MGLYKDLGVPSQRPTIPLYPSSRRHTLNDTLSVHYLFWNSSVLRILRLCLCPSNPTECSSSVCPSSFLFFDLLSSQSVLHSFKGSSLRYEKIRVIIMSRRSITLNKNIPLKYTQVHFLPSHREPTRLPVTNRSLQSPLTIPDPMSP